MTEHYASTLERVGETSGPTGSGVKVIDNRGSECCNGKGEPVIVPYLEGRELLADPAKFATWFKRMCVPGAKPAPETQAEAETGATSEGQADGGSGEAPAPKSAARARTAKPKPATAAKPAAKTAAKPKAGGTGK